MRYPTRTEINKFNELLGLKEDPLNQDWEIECSDPDRLDEFIHCYELHAKFNPEKRTLMALILGAFEPYHALNYPNQEAWGKVRLLLENDLDIHKELIEYYQCYDEIDGEDIFPITRRIREIKF